MTQQDKKKFVNYSPVGILKYPRLNKPDEYNGQSFFKAVLVLDPTSVEVQEFVNKLETHVFSNLTEKDYRPLKMVDGMLELTVKRKADFGAPKFFKPTGERSSELLEKAPGLIWGGTEASVSFTSYNYGRGVTFALAGVTIHKLVEPEKQAEVKKDISSIFDK